MNGLKLVLVMILWGSLGVFTRYIPLSALSLAFLRALIALPVLFAAMRMGKAEKPEWRSLVPYIVSGVLLGFGWLTLFQGYKHTSIASAVIIYNMCPVYVMVFAPLVLKETIPRIQIAVVFTSFLGLLLIVGGKLAEGYGYMGMALSAVSGILYAIIVLINRSVKVKVDNRTSTFTQMVTAMIVLLPFVLMEGDIHKAVRMDAMAVACTLMLGVLHTGVAYTIYFSLYSHMKSMEIVTFGYLEPLFAILFSVILLREALTLPQIIGGVLILGSTFLGELIKDRKPLVLPPSATP